MKHGWDKIPNWECLFVHREKGLFLSVYVDDIKLAGKKYKVLIRCGKYSIKKSIWENQHLSWITYTWTALNDNVKQAILWTKQTMFGSRISVERTVKATIRIKIFVFPSWSYDMAGHAKKCVERYCELQTSRLNNSSKYLLHASMNHHFKEEETKSVGEFSQGCSRIFLNYLYLERIGRPDIL